MIDEPVADLGQVDIGCRRELTLLLFGRIGTLDVLVEPFLHDLGRVLREIAALSCPS